MGYFSQLAIDREETYRFDRDGLKHTIQDYNKQIPTKAILEYYLKLLSDKLDALESVRPHDPMHPAFDRMFYARSKCHYYENPQTVCEILSAISEVNTLLDVLEHKSAPDWKDAEYHAMSKNYPQQTLISDYWEYGFLFQDVEAYCAALPVITRCA